MTRRQEGFTLVEVLVAMTLLAVSLLGLAMLFPIELRLGTSSQVAGETLRLAQKELDQIRSHAFETSGSFTDVDGNTVDVSCGGSPGTSCGNPLTASGEIDFAQAPPVGFSAQLTDPSGRLYSVRWNITVTASEGKKILLAATPLNPGGGISRAIQLQTLVAQ
jgi:prepilin-type N-terminal cleavage/methylation domain-containing protein